MYSKAVIPPKISYLTTAFGRVKIIRSSRWCKLLGLRYIAIWNRVYAATPIITQKMFQHQLKKIQLQRTEGFWKHIRKSLTTYSS